MPALLFVVYVGSEHINPPQITCIKQKKALENLPVCWLFALLFVRDVQFSRDVQFLRGACLFAPYVCCACCRGGDQGPHGALARPLPCMSSLHHVRTADAVVIDTCAQMRLCVLERVFVFCLWECVESNVCVCVCVVLRQAGVYVDDHSPMVTARVWPPLFCVVHSCKRSCLIQVYWVLLLHVFISIPTYKGEVHLEGVEVGRGRFCSAPSSV